MELNELVYEKKEGMARVILNRPEKRNALSSAMIRELLAVLQDANNDEEIKVIILTGSGKAFCAGGDLEGFLQKRTRGAPALYSEGIESTKLFRMSAILKKPLVVAVNGAAVGGGCGLVAMSHLAVAAEQAKLGTPEIKVGMFPFVIFPLLVRCIGPRKALELALAGELIDAQEAKQIGLVNYVVPAEALEEKTLDLARMLAGYSPLVIRLGLDAFNQAGEMEINKAFSYLSMLRVIDFLSEDLKEGAQAFLEKRPPRWQGR